MRKRNQIEWVTINRHKNIEDDTDDDDVGWRVYIGKILSFWINMRESLGKKIGKEYEKKNKEDANEILKRRNEKNEKNIEIYVLFRIFVFLFCWTKMKGLKWEK